MRNTYELAKPQTNRARRTNQSDWNALKSAVAHAVGACGTLESAARATRIDESRISRCANPDKPDDWLTIDCAKDIDIAAGYPYIAEAMLPAGYVIMRAVPVEAGELEHQDAAQLLENASDLLCKTIEVLADNRISPRERRDLQGLCNNLKDRLRHFDGKLNCVPQIGEAAE